jgi:hypothetical protein
MNNNLVKNKIYQGFYTFNREEYFSFFKINNDDTVVDIITNQNFDLDKFIIIYHDVNSNYIKYIKYLYKNDKSLKVFIKKDYIDVHLNTFFSKILRFFGLQDYKELSSTDNNKEKLNSVIFKLKKYTRRYMDQPSVDIYVKHLEQFKSINNILSVLPTELTEKVNPFWAKILQDGSLFTWSADLPIKAYDAFNYFGFNVLEIFKNKEIIKNKYKEILNSYIPTCETICDEIFKNFKDKNKELLESKFQDALATLNAEIKQAQENDDNDLLMEINVIRGELDIIKEKTLITIENLKIDTNIEEWFPDLLYPIPDNSEIQELVSLYTEFKTTINTITEHGTYPYYNKDLIDFIKNDPRLTDTFFKQFFNIFVLRNYFND